MARQQKKPEQTASEAFNAAYESFMSAAEKRHESALQDYVTGVKAAWAGADAKTVDAQLQTAEPGGETTPLCRAHTGHSITGRRRSAADSRRKPLLADRPGRHKTPHISAPPCSTAHCPAHPLR